MARFLFTTWEGGGHVQPMMLAAQGLRARGHDVVVLSDACNASDAAALDLPFQAWTQAPSRPDKTAASDLLKDWEADNPMESVGRLCDRIIAGPAALYARDVLAALETFPADVVVTQELLFGSMMAAEKTGAPLALFTANVWPFPTLPGLPPFGAGMAPATDDQEIMLGASQAFDFAPEPLAEPFAYVGPYVADPVDVAAWTSPWPADDARPLVLVTSSSLYEAQEGLLQGVIAALGALPVRALVTLGPALDVADFPAPDNVQVVSSAPHGALFAQAALVVTHGGHG